MILYLGHFDTRADLPPGLIPRSEAARYHDILTLQPMLPTIESFDFIRYHATIRGNHIEYLDIQEIKKWGMTNGYDFCRSSEISKEWREYLQTLDRIYADVDRLNQLAQQMGFDDEEMQANPTIERKIWPWKAKPLSLWGPPITEQQAPSVRIVDQKISLSVYQVLAERYKQLRSEIANLARKRKQSGRDNEAAFVVRRSGNRFGVQVRRKLRGEQINLYRSFFVESDAIDWANEISEELDALTVLAQSKYSDGAGAKLSLSKLILNPDEYLKAGNGYLVEMAGKLVATETPSVQGGYASIEAIHQHSVEFEKTVVCGIYFLIRDGEIKYIGQSIDIFKRIREHRQRDYIKFDRFSMIPVRKEKLTEVETWYIRHFRPEYNRTRMRPLPVEAQMQRKRELAEENLQKDTEAAITSLGYGGVRMGQ